MTKIINLDNICKGSAAMCAVLFVLNVVMSSTLTTKGMELSSYALATNKLERENMNMEFLIAKESSMAYVEQRALGLGFEKISRPIALGELSGVAMVPGR